MPMSNELAREMRERRREEAVQEERRDEWNRLMGDKAGPGLRRLPTPAQLGSCPPEKQRFVVLQHPMVRVAGKWRPVAGGVVNKAESLAADLAGDDDPGQVISGYDGENKQPHIRRCLLRAGLRHPATDDLIEALRVGGGMGQVEQETIPEPPTPKHPEAPAVFTHGQQAQVDAVAQENDALRAENEALRNEIELVRQEMRRSFAAVSDDFGKVAGLVQKALPPKEEAPDAG